MADQGPDIRPLVIDMMSRDPDYYFVLTSALAEWEAGCRADAEDGVNPEANRKWADAAAALAQAAEDALGRKGHCPAGDRTTAPGPKPFRIRISPAHLATVDRPASLADDRSETVADTLGNWWHLAPPPPEASCANCGADLTWSWDTSAWARAEEPERGREICRQPDGTWKPHAVSTEAAAAAGTETR